jgi:hypothetical protein
MAVAVSRNARAVAKGTRRRVASFAKLRDLVQPRHPVGSVELSCNSFEAADKSIRPFLLIPAVPLQ